MRSREASTGGHMAWATVNISKGNFSTRVSRVHRTKKRPEVISEIVTDWDVIMHASLVHTITYNQLS